MERLSGNPAGDMTSVELPRWDALPGDAERCIDDIDRWAMALRDSDVVSAFSESAAGSIRRLAGVELLDSLENFASSRWDFRGGRERNLAAPSTFSERQAAAIDSAATMLGLAGTPGPRRTAYDAVIMTGGMVRAGIVKPRYLRELTDHGLEWREGVFLGGFRPFAGDESELGRALGVAGGNEFDAMTTGMELAFGLGQPASVDPHGVPSSGLAGNSVWREDSWGWNGRILRVVAAPSSRPELRRANTVDTFRFWAARAHGIRSVLVVTTPVYVPYQGAGAIEVFGLEFGMSVETVAVSATASDLGRHTQLFLPQHRAQELRSAVHGMRSLRSRLVATG